MMLPGMWSSGLQELIGYQHFFLLVVRLWFPVFFVAFLIPLGREFGKKA